VLVVINKMIYSLYVEDKSLVPIIIGGGSNVTMCDPRL
jgi:hypothetical protein